MKRKNKSLISSDLNSVIERDPATSTKLEAILFSSGFHAIVCHRFAHYLWQKKWHISARFVSSVARF